MRPIQEKTLEIVGSIVLGGLTARLFTSASFKQGALFGGINGLAVSSISSEKNRTLFSIGSLALVIIGARLCAAKLPERINIPSGKDLLTLALPPALYVLGTSYLSPIDPRGNTPPSSLVPKPKTEEKKPETPAPKVHKHKSPDYVSGKGKSSEERMKKNFEKALNEHLLESSTVYATPKEVLGTEPFTGTLSLSTGADTKIGRRGTNEDTHVIHTFKDGSSLFGVFDGHGGAQASEIARNHAAKLFEEQLRTNSGDILKAFEGTIHALHEKVTTSGSTVVMSYFDPKTNRLYTATLADAEANIYRQVGDALKSIPLSPVRNWKTDEKHLPENSINKYGSEDPKWWRVPRDWYDAVNVSRSIGDKDISLVSQKPKVTVTQLLPSDILVLCCDGLKDFVSEEKVVATISAHREHNPEVLAQVLTKTSVDNQYGSGDNVTVIVVKVDESK